MTTSDDATNPVPDHPPNHDQEKHPPVDLRLLATAYHEAGHAVVALAVGRVLHKISIAPGQSNLGVQRAGQCQLQKGRRRSAEDWLEDEVLILLAGMVAEGRLTGEYCEAGAGQDLRFARRLLASRGASERQLERLERRMLDKTEHLLHDSGHWRAVEAIAAELLKHTTISGRAAQHLFQLATRDE